jgi:uncharacterized membrane protein (UPF0127 family)
MPSNTRWRKQQYSQVILVGVLLVGLALGVYGYAGYREKASLLPVTFRSGDHETSRVYLEIANTPSEREKGLMFRKSMDEDRGMLFIFPVERQQSFWMKNTYIPLDMIFVSSQFEVVGIVENATPFSEERRSVPGVSQFVIELNGGRAKELGIEAGDKVNLLSKIPPAA